MVAEARRPDRISVASCAKALRAFFLHAEEHGWCPPRWNDVQRLIASTNTDQPRDIRDRGMLMLFAEGLSQKEIGDHLGHRSSDATRVYAKVDILGLREVASFDLGGVS